MNAAWYELPVVKILLELGEKVICEQVSHTI